MTLARLLAASILWAISAAVAAGADAPVETPFEANIQYALENLTSGTASTIEVRGTVVKILPTRTWKSVTGHYCRSYEITITEPGGSPMAGERTRCREHEGGWRLVKQE